MPHSVRICIHAIEFVELQVSVTNAMDFLFHRSQIDFTHAANENTGQDEFKCCSPLCVAHGHRKCKTTGFGCTIELQHLRLQMLLIFKCQKSANIQVFFRIDGSLFEMFLIIQTMCETQNTWKYIELN